MEEKKFYTEEELIELFEESKIGWNFYVRHHECDYVEDFEDYCKMKGLDSSTDEAASDYLENWLTLDMEERLKVQGFSDEEIETLMKSAEEDD